MVKLSPASRYPGLTGRGLICRGVVPPARVERGLLSRGLTGRGLDRRGVLVEVEDASLTRSQSGLAISDAGRWMGDARLLARPVLPTDFSVHGGSNLRLGWSERSCKI